MEGQRFEEFAICEELRLELAHLGAGRLGLVPVGSGVEAGEDLAGLYDLPELDGTGHEATSLHEADGAALGAAGDAMGDDAAGLGSGGSGGDTDRRIGPSCGVGVGPRDAAGGGEGEGEEGQEDGALHG